MFVFRTVVGPNHGSSTVLSKCPNELQYPNQLDFEFATPEPDISALNFSLLAGIRPDLPRQ
jgi:hypothetical protein